MKVYEITDLGSKVLKNVSDGSKEIRILDFIDARGQASESELEVVATSGQLRSLKKSHLIREATA